VADDVILLGGRPEGAGGFEAGQQAATTGARPSGGGQSRSKGQLGGGTPSSNNDPFGPEMGITDDDVPF